MFYFLGASRLLLTGMTVTPKMLSEIWTSMLQRKLLVEFFLFFERQNFIAVILTDDASE